MNTDQVILAQYIRNHPQQVVSVLKEFKEEHIAAFLGANTTEMATGIIGAMSSYRAARYLERLPVKQAAAILDKVDLLSKRAILRQCDERFRTELLNAMAPRQANVLKQNLAFREETIGFLMNPLSISFKDDLTAAEATAVAKNEEERILSNILVVDGDGRPKGIIRFRDLLLADGDTPTSQLMTTEFPLFYADELFDSVKDDPGWYEFQSIPVIDRSETLIGSLDFKTVRLSRSSDDDRHENMAETGSALGELYRIGFTGLLQSVSK